MDKALRPIRRALVSVFHKEPARNLVACLHRNGAELFSTGGTLTFIREMGIPVKAVEDLTGYPSILGGRVKTLHPAVFGGILARREHEGDPGELEKYGIPAFDAVVVDLYPFEETVAGGAPHEDIIEKIDIGGISLIRAAAKNHRDVLVVPAPEYFDAAAGLIESGKGATTLAERQWFAAAAFDVSSHYDTAIFSYLSGKQPDGQNLAGQWLIGQIPEGEQMPGEQPVSFKQSVRKSVPLRYGENPHQQGRYFGDLQAMFEQLNGKALSYNNLLDIDAALQVIGGRTDHCFAIIKHTNVCGMAIRENLLQAWEEALSGDPVSAFGGILITNRNITEAVAYAINELFFEVLIAPGYDESALEILRQKKNRILLKRKEAALPASGFRSALNGVLWQTADTEEVMPEGWTHPTKKKPAEGEEQDLLFANWIVRNLKSNAIALVKDQKLLGTGMGQTSRVDALNHAIAKARAMGHSLEGAVMASDAFFPFPDCVEIAHKEGITAVIQPGGSLRDKESVDYCDRAGMAMVFTGKRHFKH
jgi:phosphoribosylaminoimidazolecarboxamide formyltransferase / IMP cyclohydrolase